MTPRGESRACGRPTTRSSPTGRGPSDRQDPPRPADTKPAADQGPLVIQAEVVDPEGHRLSGVDVVATIWYPRSSEDSGVVLERDRSDAQGQVRLEVARERPGAKVSYASVWAYQPGRAIATTNVSLDGKCVPAGDPPDPGSTGEMDHHRPSGRMTGPSRDFASLRIRSGDSRPRAAIDRS